MSSGVQAPPTFLQKLQFRPGINRESTFYANAGGYWDCNRIRFRQGRPETIGGWQRNGTEEYNGSPRALMAWVDLAGEEMLAVGDYTKYYIQAGGSVYDITPIRSTVNPMSANPLSTTNGSTTVTVSVTAHGALLGDYVTFSGLTAVATIPTGDLNIEHQITAIPTVNTFTITVATPANATTTGGGAVGIAAFQINIGLDSVVLGTGWGAGPWGMGGWGLSSSTSVAGAQLRLWSQDNFGEDLLFNPRDGGIYFWDRSGGFSARAVNISTLGGASDTPIYATQVLVSDSDRHVFAFGTNAQGGSTQDKLLIRWSDQEDMADWTATFTTTAGDLRIGSGSFIMRALQTRQEILVWTDVSLHSVQFLGPPFIFGMNTISSNTSLIGPNAVVDTGDGVIWMGLDNFYVYTGRVQPLPCSVQEYVFTDINLAQSYKICAGTNKQFNEAWFFYPCADSEENDRYVKFDYAQNIWDYGVIARTAWLDQGLFRNALGACSDHKLYDHEVGLDDGETNPVTTLDSFITTSPIEIGQGDNFMLVRRMLPDLTFEDSEVAAPSLDVVITGYTYPGGSYEPTADGSVTKVVSTTIEKFTQAVPLRVRARSMSFTYSHDTVGVRWRIGDPRIELRPDGKR